MPPETQVSQDYRTFAEYDMVQKRRNADSWNPDQERILKIWAEKASGWAWLHDKAGRYYNHLTDRMTYPSIVLSTVSGGLGFSIYGSVSNSGDTGSGLVGASKYLTIAIGCMNLSAALLAALQKFVRSTEKSEMHNQMYKVFSSYYRKIVMELALKPSDRRDCLEFCKLCRDEYDKMVADSPEIPDKIIADFKRVFSNAKHVPEIANGLVHFHDYKVTQEGIDFAKRRSRSFLRTLSFDKDPRIPPILEEDSMQGHCHGHGHGSDSGSGSSPGSGPGPGTFMHDII